MTQPHSSKHLFRESKKFQAYFFDAFATVLGLQTAKQLQHTYLNWNILVGIKIDPSSIILSFSILECRLAFR